MWGDRVSRRNRAECLGCIVLGWRSVQSVTQTWHFIDFHEVLNSSSQLLNDRNTRVLFMNRVG